MAPQTGTVTLYLRKRSYAKLRSPSSCKPEARRRAAKKLRVVKAGKRAFCGRTKSM
jgi:hypothetical protein